MRKRQRFQPASLMFGLPVTGAGVVYVLEAVEVLETPTIVLLLLVPAAIALGIAANILVGGLRWACGTCLRQSPGATSEVDGSSTR